MATPAIVLVEAFPEILQKLKNDLESKESDRHRLIEANSSQQALAQLRQLSLQNVLVALLLVDAQILEMHGSEFLKEARALYPQAKCILLTTYADTHTAIQAINIGLIDYFIIKPWDPPQERFYPVLDDLLASWETSYHPPSGALLVISHRWSPRLHEIMDFLARNLVPYRSHCKYRQY